MRSSERASRRASSRQCSVVGEQQVEASILVEVGGLRESAGADQARREPVTFTAEEHDADVERIGQKVGAAVGVGVDGPDEFLGDVDARLMERPVFREDAVSLAAAPDTMRRAEALVREASASNRVDLAVDRWSRRDGIMSFMDACCYCAANIAASSLHDLRAKRYFGSPETARTKKWSERLDSDQSSMNGMVPYVDHDQVGEPAANSNVVAHFALAPVSVKSTSSLGSPSISPIKNRCVDSRG